jgi:mono/diheme cytochrome c family protein
VKQKAMKHFKQILVVVVAAGTGLAACGGGGMRRNPGKAYAPDMTYSRAYEFYSENPNFSDSMTARLPVMGTVARGHALPDHLVEGDTLAYKTFSTNVKFSDEEITEGKRLFNIYCAICHGTAMDGNGPLYASGKFAAMPANLKDPNKVKMPVGQIYAAIKFGKNAMGSYASQLDAHQRWMIIAYIRQQQAGAGGEPFTMGMNAPAAAAKATTADTAQTTKGGSGAKQESKG